MPRLQSQVFIDSETQQQAVSLAPATVTPSSRASAQESLILRACEAFESCAFQASVGWSWLADAIER
ncbi:hypothetical protein [Rhizobium sp. BT03]|uniref:hypothetical protein n=1 Tax=Rhizobium sp. BT03 TaxID=3045156 RepID=UPI0024B3CEE7|nr:hypothetical protein [Rhizobium sp. BT03]WHO75131.1 hypothetical protein QMO80_004223 [Rhizobium sp. BT03]